MAMIGRIYAVLSVMAATAGIGPATAFADDGTQRRAADVRPAFEPNQGQFSPDVRFASRGHGYTLFLTDTEAVLALHASDASDRRSAVRISLTNGAARRPTPLERLPGVINYLRGQDPTRWHTAIATYGRVTYPDVYPGVDIVYYAHDGTHEFDLVLAPRADPSAIGLRVSGADRVEVDAAGDLQLSTSAGTLTMKAPHVYQAVGSTRARVEARYTIDEAGQIGFAIGAYDASASLVIDPQFLYSTFLGGTGDVVDQALGVAVDRSGAAYIVGTTEAADFPTQAAIHPQRNGDADAFVTKLSPDGTLVYSTYLGGSGYETGDAVTVRDDGTAFILGSTNSSDFVVVGGGQSQYGGGSADAFIAVLHPTGTAIVRSTYLGGSGAETPLGLQLTRASDTIPLANDVFGDVLVAYGSTTSTNFPTVQPGQAARVGDRDGFLTVFDRQTLAPVYASYAGVAGSNYPQELQLNRRTGAMYLVLRRTDDLGPNLARFTRRPPADGIARPAAVPGEVGWALGVAALDFGLQQDEADRRRQAKGLAPVSCKAVDQQNVLVGGVLMNALCGSAPRSPSPDEAAADVIDSIVMATTMPGCIPVAPATQCSDRAVLMFHDHNGHMVGHINFGGQRVGRDFSPIRSVFGSDGRIHIIGATSDTTLPVVNPVQATHRGSSEGFVMSLDSSSGATTFLSYLGGGSFDTLLDIAVDATGNRWIVGDTQSANFPLTPNAVQPALRGRIDGFVVKISADPPGPVAPTGLAAQTSGLNVALSWNAVAGASSYQVEAGTAPLSSNLAVVNVGNVTALQTLGPAGTYYIRVRALTAAGLTGASNEVTVVLALPGSCTSAPPAPTGHTAQVANLNITLSWNASAGATSYVLQAGNASGASNLLNANIGATTALSAIGPPGTFFTRVRAVNACGTSGPSNEISFTLGCSAPPAAPTPLTFSKTATLLTLNWAASPGAAGYRLRVGTTSGASNVLDADIGNTTGLQANVAGVPAASYFVRVVATNGCGLSGASNEVTIPIP